MSGPAWSRGSWIPHGAMALNESGEPAGVYQCEEHSNAQYTGRLLNPLPARILRQLMTINHILNSSPGCLRAVASSPCEGLFSCATWVERRREQIFVHRRPAQLLFKD